MGGLTGALLFVYLFYVATIGLCFGILEILRPSQATFLDQLAAAGIVLGTFDDIVLSVVHVANLTNATQLMIFTSILCGHAVLHDRQCGTLAFLLLAPLTRAQLLVAKVIGAMVIPTGIYATAGLLMVLAPRALKVTEPAADLLPFSGGWTVGFLLATPIWSFVIGALCAIVSSIARDVRTAQMVTSIVVYFTSVGLGAAIVAAIPEGAVAQLGLSIVGVFAAAATVMIGSSVISRDLSR